MTLQSPSAVQEIEKMKAVVLDACDSGWDVGLLNHQWIYSGHALENYEIAVNHKSVNASHIATSPE